MLRVVEWSTGNVGRHAIAGIDAHPELELVGVWVSSEAKMVGTRESWPASAVSSAWRPRPTRRPCSRSSPIASSTRRWPTTA